MKALITAGGKGTRMRPLTFSTNKHFISLVNKPLLFYAIETVAGAGIKEIGLNYNPGQLEEIKSYLGNGEKWGVRFTYILQPAPLGLADIIKVSQGFLGGDKFLMHLGDNIFYGGIKPLVDLFLKSKANGMALIVHHPENRRMGVPYFDKNGKLIKFVEKPENPPNDFGGVGLYFFDHHVFDCFEEKDGIRPSPRGELEIVSCFNWLLDNGYKVKVNEFKGAWLDPGKFDDWIETNRFLLEKNIRNSSASVFPRSVKVDGKVKVGRNCRVKNSVLRGPTIIGDGVIIENSTVGPYCSIGDDCRIFGSKVENSILTRAVRLENVSRVVENSLIGEGTVVENGPKVNLFVGNQCCLKL